MNTPRAALTAAVCMVGLICALFAALAMSGSLDAKSTPLLVTLITLVTSSVPALIAAGYAERAARDIRNGVLVDKTKEGAKQAMDENGVTDLVESQREEN